MNDIIVAISSAIAPGIRGIVRLSGVGCFKILKNCYRVHESERKSNLKPYIRTIGEFWFEDWQAGVAADVYVMKSPHSYTGEDMVEVHTFSCLPLLDKIVRMFLELGARPAEPGEFTRRAFVNGKIDLAQVESVQALIHATSEAEQKMAVLGLTGELSRKLSKISERLSYFVALLEAYIDFVEEDIGEPPFEEIREKISSAWQALEDLTKSPPNTSQQKFTVCLCGFPNVGKSSLFNKLLGEEAAITSEIAGTTLDWLEGSFCVSDIEFRIIDMPGFMDSEDSLQIRAQEKARELLRGADFILYLIDGTKEISEESFLLCEKLPEIPILFLRTKTDLYSLWSHEELKKHHKNAELHDVSIYQENTVEEVENWLYRKGRIQDKEPGLLNIRQYYAAKEAQKLLEHVIACLANNLSYELLVVDLRSALDFIGEIVGKVTTEDILDHIFSNFCIGK